jgi:ketosteroid isomerase-like protein
MKIHVLLALAGLAIGFAAPAFAQQKDTTDPQIAQQLEAIGRKSDEAWDKGDAAGIAAFFTQNAVVVTPQGPVYGRQAIEKMYADLFQKMHFSNHLTKADENSPPITGTAGNEVWWFGAWSVTVQSQNDPPRQAKGYWSAVHIREGDAWKICMLTFNSTPAPPATGTATPSPTTTPSSK